MKRLKVRVFTSGKLSGEGFLGVFSRGTIGRNWDCTVLSPSVKEKVSIWRKLSGKIAVKFPKNSLKEAQLDGVPFDRNVLMKLGTLREGFKRESIIFPSPCLIKLIFEGFDLTISEESYAREVAIEEATAEILSGEFRRRPFAGDSRFLLILTASMLCYIALHTTVLLIRAPKINVKKDIPRRFTRFIYEPPVPASRTLEREIPVPTEKKVEIKEKREEKKDEVAKKQEQIKEKRKAEKPGIVDRNKIREKIARKGVLGILTGRGRAGSRYAENILNRVDEISKIDVKVAKLERIENPIGKEGKALAKSGISELIEESKLGSEKKFEKRIYKTETGAEMEISGNMEDKDRSAQVISSIITSYLGGIKYVYNRELRNNPNLSGKITVSFIIYPNGTVGEISVKESNINWEPLEEKVKKRIKHWKFPPSSSGKMRVVFPFLFFPSM